VVACREDGSAMESRVRPPVLGVPVKRAVAASSDRPGSAAGRWLFGPLSLAEGRRLAGALQGETVGGVLILAAAAVALVWANSPWATAYTTVRDTVVGPAAVHLDLGLGTWAADGLLAVFFFVAGLEVKREFVAGDLRDPRRAALPVVAVVGGVVTPLAVYLLVNTMDGGDAAGWAVPIATDVAFALAVLAVTGSWLPTALRTFLLTLAVVDDLIAITIIAAFFTGDLHVGALTLALIPLGLFGFLVRRRRAAWWWLLLPLAVTTWTLVHASGVHATVAGVLLALTVPVAATAPGTDPVGERPAEEGPARAEESPARAEESPARAEESPARAEESPAKAEESPAKAEESPAKAEESPADWLEHRVRPWSAGVAVPVFAFFAAGVSIDGMAGIRSAAGDPVVLGIVAGLLIGKPVGVWGAARLTARLTRAELDDDLGWADVAGLALLSGIGFTVSLLIGELAFGPNTPRDDHVKIAVLTGSLLSAMVASLILQVRNRAHRPREDPAGGNP
jgi:NhaA family Na+:H+ antiporter